MAKVVSAGIGTTLNAAQASKDDLRKRFWNTIHVGRVVVWCWWTGWSSIFPKHPFRQVSILLFILFFKSYTGTKWLVGHPVEFNQFHTPTRGDDLCLSFCLILNLWLLYTQLHKVWQIEAWFLSPLHYSISRRNPSKDMSTYWPIRAIHVPYLLVQVITEERVKKNMRVF